MSEAYVEHRNGVYTVGGTRVSLDSVVYLEDRRQDFAAARQAARDADPMFYQKLAEAKKHTPLTS